MCHQGYYESDIGDNAEIDCIACNPGITTDPGTAAQDAGDCDSESLHI